MTRFIFITGGVVSSLGKGLCSAALGALLQARGFKVRLRKLDPYLNVDPGTMSPYQHGEVYVTDDGAETDLDLGHYERYVGVAARKSDSVTTGRIYSTVIGRERRGEYLGATVQVIPHVTDAIKEFILADIDDEDVIRFDHGDRTYAVYRVAGKVYATDGLCTHEQVHLCDGLVMDCVIECPMHNGRFDIRDGRALGAPACVNLKTYPAKIEDDIVFILVE